jgi:hypothetical protein
MKKSMPREMVKPKFTIARQRMCGDNVACFVALSEDSNPRHA